MRQHSLQTTYWVTFSEVNHAWMCSNARASLAAWGGPGHPFNQTLRKMPSHIQVTDPPPLLLGNRMPERGCEGDSAVRKILLEPSGWPAVHKLDNLVPEGNKPEYNPILDQCLTGFGPHGRDIPSKSLYSHFGWFSQKISRISDHIDFVASSQTPRHLSFWRSQTTPTLKSSIIARA